MSQCAGCDLCKAALDIEETQGATRVPFKYAPMFQSENPKEVEWYRLEGDYVESFTCRGREMIQVDPKGLTALAHQAYIDIMHFFRHDHLQGWANVLKDPESSGNDKFVCLELLKNACIASAKILPACQDTGTAIVLGKKGECVWTNGQDEEALSRGVYDAYTNHFLRYSQVAPIDMFREQDTKCNLPAQLDLMATHGNEYKFLFVAKGGGSANKSQLFQQTKALLNPKSLRKFIEEKLKGLGTAACPPYHIALVIGGSSAELNLKVVKLASCRYLDDLPTTGDETGRAFRDLEWEKIVMEIAQGLNIGAQFGGKAFAHQARVIRLPRHGASCPVGIGVSCSADRQILGKITKDGIFLEKLVRDPAAYLPEVLPTELGDTVVKIDLNRPMSEIRRELSQYPIKTRLSLSGPLVVARDIAHAKILERLESGQGLPQYIVDRIVYYAGPAKTPPGYASGSFGPTTAGRMDSYLAPFMAAGGGFISLAKGNRSKQVTDACKKYGGFYLGSIGGPAAALAMNSIKKVEVLEYPELGMEAIWSIEVEDFPAFIVVDDKGNDFFADLV